MPAEEKYFKILTTIDIPSETKLWIRSYLFGLVLLAGAFFYIPLSRGGYDIYTMNKALGDVGIFLIGLSFALSGICYFWNFADTKFVYRKHLGLTGFVFGAMHGLISLFLIPERFSFPSYYLAKVNILPFVFGLTAIVIFTGMALISNKYAVHELGGKLWRHLLRVGYIAMFFILLHFGLMKFQYWFPWATGGFKTLPSLSLIAAIIIVIVLLLRVALEVSVRRKKVV
ncbi:MAG: hypothetical protein Q7S61_06025 [bacterium]|nr:hypothetical protein [bacterium]